MIVERTEGTWISARVSVASNVVVPLNSVSVTNNQTTAVGSKGGGGYVMKGTLAGSLTALTGNSDGAGVNGATAGIAYKKPLGDATITRPATHQPIVEDR